MSVQLTIAGDCCITKDYLDTDIISPEVTALLAGQDINIINLECPVAGDGETHKIKKQGPHLRTKEKIFDHLSKLHTGVATLANNHILDFGTHGLDLTIQACLRHGITYTGAGKNLAEAAVPVLVEKNGIRIALVNCCENEWSIATETNPGANPYDPIDLTAQLQQAKAMADFVLLIIHGGHETYQLPSPRMQKQFRFLSQQGADAVICHHAHCISGMEVYKGIPIFYGLGNLVFTTANEMNNWFRGMMLQLQLEKGSPIKWTLIPTVQQRSTYKLSIAEGAVKQELLDEVQALSEVIADPAKLNAAWQKFVAGKSQQYLYTLSAMNAIPGRYLRAVLKRLGIMNRLFPERYLKGVMNYINCEAHLDVSREVFNNKLYKK